MVILLFGERSPPFRAKRSARGSIMFSGVTIRSAATVPRLRIERDPKLCTGARVLGRGGWPEGAKITHRAFLDGLMPLFCTDRYIKRISGRQDFFTAGTKYFLRGPATSQGWFRPEPRAEPWSRRFPPGSTSRRRIAPR